MSQSGLGIYLPRYGLMGFVEISALPGRGWRHDGRQGVLRNARTGRQIGFGDEFEVEMTSCDPVRGEAVFVPSQG